LGRYFDISSTPYWLNGTLDDIRIYNRAITSDEVVSLYNQPNPAINLVNINDGLMAYYPFTGNDLDSSGNHNNPTFNNATPTTDRFGTANSAYYFDGASSFMEIPNSATLNPTNNLLSMSVWVKPDGFNSIGCKLNYILSKEPTSGGYGLEFSSQGYSGGNQCSLSVDTLHQDFYGPTNFANNNIYSPFIKEGEWYHVVYTYDGDSTKIYINGKLGFATKETFVSIQNNGDLFFGKIDNSSIQPYWFKGTLDEVRLYKRALNTAEVAALYNITKDTSKTLPVSLKSFTAAEITSTYTRIDISTANESSAAYVEIERSYDGNSFTVAGTLKSNGNAKGSNYSFTDRVEAGATKVYYRLKLIDNNGSYTYSKVVTVTIGKAETLTVELYPNPVGNTDLKVNLYAAKDDAIAIRVVDINGKLVASQKVQVTKGLNSFSVAKFNSLGSGIYMVNITSSNSVINKKVIKVK